MDSIDQLDDFAEEINLCPSSPIAISFASNHLLCLYIQNIRGQSVMNPWLKLGNQSVILLETALERGNPFKNLNKAYQSEKIYFLKL